MPGRPSAVARRLLPTGEANGRIVVIAGSSNGRTSPFEGEYLGSSPSPAAPVSAVSRRPESVDLRKSSLLHEVLKYKNIWQDLEA